MHVDSRASRLGDGVRYVETGLELSRQERHLKDEMELRKGANSEEGWFSHQKGGKTPSPAAARQPTVLRVYPYHSQDLKTRGHKLASRHECA